MRKRRILLQMAGVSPTIDRLHARDQRRLVRAQHEIEKTVMLADQIRQREQGEPGTKRMPFAVCKGHGRMFCPLCDTN